jgi:hypothetical protein
MKSFSEKKRMGSTKAKDWRGMMEHYAAVLSLLPSSTPGIDPCAGYFRHPLTTLDIILEIFPCLSPLRTSQKSR